MSNPLNINNSNPPINTNFEVSIGIMGNDGALTPTTPQLTAMKPQTISFDGITSKLVNTKVGNQIYGTYTYYASGMDPGKEVQMTFSEGEQLRWIRRHFAEIAKGDNMARFWIIVKLYGENRKDMICKWVFTYCVNSGEFIPKINANADSTEVMHSTLQFKADYVEFFPEVENLGN